MNRFSLKAIGRLIGILVLTLGTCVQAQNPAYDPPANYYNSASGLTGTALKSALNNIIRGHTVIPYTSTLTDVWDALQVLDEDPNNTANVILVYNGTSRPKTDTNGNGNNTVTVESWEREHCWPKSYGVEDNGADTSDLFNLRACRRTVNASRNNRFYDQADPNHPVDPAIAPPNCPLCLYDYDEGQGGMWTPRPSEKGDLARAMFYMAVRYDGRDTNTTDLELGNVPNDATAVFGNLTTLLSWSAADPVSEEERLRNHRIYTQFQGNRNPFIDHPEMIQMVFGNAPATPAITVSLSLTLVNEGAVTSGTVTLSSPAAGNVTVTLSKTGDADHSEISIPASVVISEGQTSVPFTLTALTDGIDDGDVNVSITGASSGYDSGLVVVTVVDVDETPGGGSGNEITGPGFHTQNFNSLPNTGTPEWVDDATLPGWLAQRTGSATTILSGTGSSATGGLYSFGTAADERALGSLGSSSSGALAWGVTFRNTTTQVVTLTTLSYTGEQWRNSGAVAQAATFSYKQGNVAVTDLTPGSDSGWTALPVLDFTSPVTGGTAGALNGNDSANRTAKSTALNLQLQPGQWITFRWRDVDHSGSDHALAIDDFRLDWTLPVVEEPPVINSPLAANAQVGSAFAYTITASNSPEFFEAESLPPGLSVNGTTGVISGTPSEAGVFEATIVAGNDGGSDIETLVITVAADTTTFAEWSGGAPLTPDLLRAYAIGGASGPQAPGAASTSSVQGNVLVITAIVRVDHPDLTVIGEASPDLNFGAGQATAVAGTTAGVSQAGVPAGCERREFRIATDGVRHFMRLRVDLDP